MTFFPPTSKVERRWPDLCCMYNFAVQRLCNVVCSRYSYFILIQLNISYYSGGALLVDGAMTGRVTACAQILFFFVYAVKRVAPDVVFYFIIFCFLFFFLMHRWSLRCRSPRTPRTHYTEHAAGTTTTAADNVLDPPLGRHGRAQDYRWRTWFLLHR